MAAFESKYINVDGIRTHYLEAGEGPHFVLLHSGEFGACSEFSWEPNIPYFAEHFHVVAMDWLGYGYTDKVHEFGRQPTESGPQSRRTQHLARFLEVLSIDDADFMGNSAGASFFLREAATAGPEYRDVLPIRKMVCISPTVSDPPTEGYNALLTYDGTREHMRRIVDALFYDQKYPNDEAGVERRYQMSLVPGHWECMSAARLRRPGAEGGRRLEPAPLARVIPPTLMVTGVNDKLTSEKDGGMEELRAVQNGEFKVFDKSGHCSHIEHADEFNELVLRFLLPS